MRSWSRRSTPSRSAPGRSGPWCWWWWCGIASVLVVSVVQKRREIGILVRHGRHARADPAAVPGAGRVVVGALGSALGIALAVGRSGLHPLCAADGCRCLPSRCRCWGCRWR